MVSSPTWETRPREGGEGWVGGGLAVMRRWITSFSCSLQQAWRCLADGRLGCVVWGGGGGGGGEGYWTVHNE